MFVMNPIWGDLNEKKKFLGLGTKINNNKCKKSTINIISSWFFPERNFSRNLLVLYAVNQSWCYHKKNAIVPFQIWWTNIMIILNIMEKKIR